MRGLKHKENKISDADYQVAPYVGAWIETQRLFKNIANLSVAPYVGAWIETDEFDALGYEVTRRTLRGCVD